MQKKEDDSFYTALKTELELKFGRKVKYSKDCKLLSDQIFVMTGRRLSESTIKRFFGIISTSFMPSKYTLDTYAVYLGYRSWDIFVQSRKQSNHDSSGVVDQNVLKECFKVVTDISISSMEERTGYSPKKFIRRAAAEERLMNFFRSDKTATILVGPKGYGKTSILLQFFHTHFSGNDKHFKDALICVLDGGIFFSMYNQPQCNLVLKPLIEFDVKAVHEFFLNSDEEYRKESYILFIDDFDRILLGREKFYQLAGNIMQLIMINKRNPRFKLILTCAPESIDTFSSYILYNPLLAESFYDVNFRYSNQYEAVNIPVFSLPEIREVLVKNRGISSFSYLSLYYPDVFEIIKVPVFLSYFLRHEEFAGGDFSAIRFLNNMVRHFVFSKPFAEEKQQVVRKFIQQCDINEEFPSVAKETLIEEENHRIAYQELINNGLIQEFIEPSDTPDILWKVRFSNTVIFEYILARFLTNNSNIDTSFLNDVITRYRNSISVQYALLKWIIRLSFFDENHDLLKQVHTTMERTVNIEKETAGDTMPGTLRSIQNAYSEGLRVHESSSVVLMPWLAQSKLGRRLYFGAYFDLDSLMFFPEKSLDVFEEAENTPDARLMTSYLRFLKCYYSLDYAACSREFEKISQINYSDIKNRYFAGYYFSAYFQYASLLKSSGNMDLLGEVISYCESFKEKGKHSFRYVPPFEFFLIFNLNSCDYFEEIVTLARYLDPEYEYAQLSLSGYYQLFKLCQARALLFMGDEKNALRIFSKFKKHEYPAHMRHFMQLNENLAMVDFMEHQHKTAEALRLLYETKALSQLMGYHYYTQKAEDLESKLLNARKDMRSD